MLVRAAFCLFGMALVGCARPAASPVMVSTELRIFNDAPDWYEPLSLQISVDGQPLESSLETLQRDGRYTWRGTLELSKSRRAEVVAVFRRDGVDQQVSAIHKITGPIGGTVVFYERKDKDRTYLATSRFRMPIQQHDCKKAADGPMVQQAIKVHDATSSKYRVESVHVEVDDKQLTNDDVGIAEAMANKKMPIFGSKLAAGCHEVSVRATLVAGDKRRQLAAETAFRAREGAAIKITFAEGSHDNLDVLFLPEN